MDERSLSTTLDQLGLERGRPVVIVVGGAAGLDAQLEAPLTRLFTDAVFPACARRGATLVDGGTDAGVMQIAGTTRRSLRSEVPLVGVVAEGTTNWGGSDLPDAASLEPNHSHVILVPGRHWGDESPWIPRIAAAIADGAPQAAIVVGGGEVTERDVRNIARSGAPIVAIRGTGGVADSFDDLSGEPWVTAIDALAAPQTLFECLMTELAPGSLG
jgi:SLOG in TRPM, prokaryote